MSQIVTVPNQVLRTPTKIVQELDKKVLEVIADMLATLKATKDPQGVGLAAPQIGSNLRIFLARPDVKGPISLFINPEIIKFSQRLQPTSGKGSVYEGCLSIPRHYAPVKRSMAITVKYQTLVKPQTPNPKPQENSNIQNPSSNLGFENWSLGFAKTEVFSGFPAHVIQHEMDHLNGILFIDRVLEQGCKLYRVDKNKEWEEVSL